MMSLIHDFAVWVGQHSLCARTISESCHSGGQVVPLIIPIRPASFVLG